MNILSINATKFGGAAVAANRLNQALVNRGIEVKRVYLGNDWYSQFWHYLSMMEQIIWPRLMKTENFIFHSSALFSKGIKREIEKYQPDLVHLHWINGGMLRPEDLLDIKIPIVWTMHDMWPFCGAEHHAEDSRYIYGYRKDNRPNTENGFDINKWVWERKKRVYERLANITFVAPSKWLYEKAKESYLLKNKKVVCIPNGLDTDIFRPMDKSQARKLLKLDLNKKYILMGAAFTVGDKNKQLEIADDVIATLDENIGVLAVGQGNEELIKNSFPKIQNRMKHLGYLDNEEKMRVVYSAADVFVMFSKHENLPNMVIESMVCGTPVVAFDVGGIRDIVGDGGILVKTFDNLVFGDKLGELLSNKEMRIRMSSDGVRHIIHNFEIKKIANAYLNLYKEAVK